MILQLNNDTDIYNTPFSMTCPHCGDATNLTLVSTPSFEQLKRYKPEKIGIAYHCSSCKEPIFLKFKIEKYDVYNNKIHIEESAIQIEKPIIDFEFEFIPDSVVSDFKEALECYSIMAFNAFASMTRRTIQSSATEIGSKGKSKVQNQIKDLKEMASIDDETFNIICQIIIDGHDGAHPHLPSLSSERAEILLELLKDVMYQLFVRKGKLKKAAELRTNQIKSSK